MLKSARWFLGNRESAVDSRQWVVGSRQWKVVRFFCSQLTAHCLLLTAHCLLLFLIPQNAILAAGTEVWPQLETRHFLVIAEPMPHPQPVALADWGTILRQYIEQLDAKLAPLFGGQTIGATQPTLGQKPILLICANKASYLRRLGEYGVANPATVIGSGGYYHPDANIILIWRQPTEYYSRHVVLHEVAHWYCLQLLGSRYGKMPLWLCEGLADHAAFHTWDGQTLQAMQLPRVSLENYPARLDTLLKRLALDDAADISLKSVSECFELLRAGQEADRVYDEYALAWGLAAFLVEQFPREMTRFFESLQQNDTPEHWQSAFDDTHRPTWRLFADWVAAHRLPWHWVWNHWEDTGTHLLGISDSTAMIVQSHVAPGNKTEQEPEITLLRCEVTPLLDGTLIGLVFRYADSDNFEMLQFRNVGNGETSWRHVRFAQKQWEQVQQWEQMQSTEVGRSRRDRRVQSASVVWPEYRQMQGGVVLEIRRATSLDGQKLRFFCDGHVVLELPDNTEALPFGLAVQSGVAQFRVEAQRH